MGYYCRYKRPPGTLGKDQKQTKLQRFLVKDVVLTTPEYLQGI